MTVKKLIIILIFLFILDNFMLPSLFGWKESTLSFIALIGSVVYFGFKKSYLIVGVFFSFILELLRGADFGEFILPFLYTILVVYIFQKFFDIKQGHYDKNIAKVLGLSFLVVLFVYVFEMFYNFDLNFKLWSFSAVLTTFIESFIFLLIVTWPKNTKFP